MSRYRLTKLANLEDKYDNNEISYDFTAVMLEDMLENYLLFLKACGYPVDGLELNEEIEND